MIDMIGMKLKQLRTERGYSMEYVAEKIDVSRQTVAKWENNETLPDVLKAKMLADLYDVSLDIILLNDDETPNEERTGKYVFGIVKTGERGQIVIPQKARKIFNISAGDQLLILGDIHQGIGIIKVDDLTDNLFQSNGTGGNKKKEN